METIKNTIGENFGGMAQSLSTHQFSLDDVPDLSGKIAIVTGGSEGIGYGCTYTLLKHNISKLYILSVSEEVAKGAKAAIGQDLGQETANRTEWLFCDISDWKKVKEVAEQLKEKTERLDILINNAARGIMTFQLTDYGVDRHMALNHMGHVVLTSHLLPLVKKTAEQGNVVRIVNQASNAHQATPSDTKFENLEELNRDLGPNGNYGRSKLAGVSHWIRRAYQTDGIDLICSEPPVTRGLSQAPRHHLNLLFADFSIRQILYARYFARHVTQAGHPNVLMNASHPGFVSTKMSKEDIHEPYPLGGYAMSIGMEPFKKNQFEGAVSTIFAATTITESGQYICPPAVPESGSELAQDDALADRLMDLTRRTVMEKTRQDSAAQGCPFDDLVLH
ncbi:hypothetical protein JX265_003788 [Neoarthrinium moseri]|uniref:Retinol dehydrogenase 12 n=1 Tax=Neoarthrinium moseri TaxID=1658444 RepID=A0A9P9WTF4_9PEZI|nr:hypothetical protein JX265_003788 [Neoarthrinium moseri]